MSQFSYIALALTLFAALGATWALLLPFFQGEDDGQGDDALELEELLRRKERLLQSLEELEQDVSMQRISAEQYESSRRELTEETAQCLARIDAFNEARADEQDRTP